MSRARLPSRLAVVSLALRFSASILSTLSFVFLVYMSIINHVTFAWAYMTSIFAMVLDTIEAATITDSQRNVPRINWVTLVVIELLVIGMCAGACMSLGMAHLNDDAVILPDGSYDADPWRMNTLGCLAAVGGLHLALVAMGVVERIYLHPSR